MSALSQLDALIDSAQRGAVIGCAGPTAPPAAPRVAAAAAATAPAAPKGKKGAKPAEPAPSPAPKGAAAAAAGGGGEATSAPDPEAQRLLDLVLSVGEECQTVDDLKNLLAKKPNFTCYDGFEPSGRMHIAQGLFKAINVNKLTSAGGTFLFWVADWFALMNDKMGGDLAKIQTVGKYLIEVWKAAGMDMERVRFLWCADEITSKASTYWPKMLDIARCFDLDRIKKCCTIMARAENRLTGAQVLYPLMQCTDVFFLRADVCQLGVDQRKVNMLARDYCGKAGVKLKPVILSHHMLYGLKAGQSKMSKSDSDSAIFMEDSAADVERKIMQAHCPRVPDGSAPSDAALHLVEDALQNPCLDYVRHIVLGRPGATFAVGPRVFGSADEVQRAFVEGQISEDELKRALVAAVNSLLQPVRDHFEQDAHARELLAQVRQFSKEAVKPAARRLELLSGSERACVVCAPLPLHGHVTLGDVLSTAALLDGAPQGCAPVLWLRDWTAQCLNCFEGSAKGVRAALVVLLAALRALRPQLMARVRVLWQSEAILGDPSNYWISAINVGRAFMLDELQQLEPAPANEQAGFVVKVLMHVADCLALAPHTLCAPPAERALGEFAARYVESQGLPKPAVRCIAPVEAQLRDWLTPGVFDPECEYTVLDNPAADGSRKLNKAYCAVGEVSRNAPLRLAQAFIAQGGALSVKRKPENGGDVEYTQPAQVEADFKSEALHPGDLKPAVVALVQGALKAVQAELAATAEAKKAEADLKTAIKQAAKLKQKK